jgi:hypothetical protein
MFYDDAADVPVCLNHRKINCTVRLIAREQQRVFNFRVDILIIAS